MNAAPIGMFDSGLGGLSIWRAVRERLPAESICYVADQARCPYGPRSREEIIRFSREITTFLVKQECKLIVVACNTATAAAIGALRQQFSVPFVGIEPALKPAAGDTRTGKVGILATEGTFRGDHFQTTRARYAQEIELILQVGEGLVELVERGALDGPETEALLTQYLQPMLAAGADQIVLGCTHYPFLRKAMESIVQKKAVILDPAPAVAAQVLRRLQQAGLLAAGPISQDQFFTTGDPGRMQIQLQSLLPQDYSPPSVQFLPR